MKSPGRKCFSRFSFGRGVMKKKKERKKGKDIQTGEFLFTIDVNNHDVNQLPYTCKQITIMDIIIHTRWINIHDRSENGLIDFYFFFVSREKSSNLPSTHPSTPTPSQSYHDCRATLYIKTKVHKIIHARYALRQIFLIRAHTQTQTHTHARV